MGSVSFFVGVGVAGPSQLSQLSNSSVSWMMILPTSGLGSIDESFSGDARLLPRIRDDEDAFTSLAFAVGLTKRLERDVCSFTVSVFLIFQPDWSVVCFVLPVSGPWPTRDGTGRDVCSFTVSVFLTFQPHWAVVYFILPVLWPWPARDGIVGFFALSAFLTFRPSWDGATLWSLPFVGSFAFSAFSTFRPSWGDAVVPSSESSPSARRNPSKVGLSS